jgi:hypothetical protein
MLYPKPEKKPKRRRGLTPADREVYDRVLQRDGTCVAPLLGAQSPCRGPLTREHVRPGGGATGMRRVTRVDAVVILCAHHHLDGWATSHKGEMRTYLEGQG